MCPGDDWSSHRDAQYSVLPVMLEYVKGSTYEGWKEANPTIPHEGKAGVSRHCRGRQTNGLASGERWPTRKLWGDGVLVKLNN